MRHAQNRSPVWKYVGVLILALIGSLLGSAMAYHDAPTVSRPPTVISVDAPEPLTLGALSSTLGWRWQGTVNVYDDTGDPAWKVAEAAREWGSRTGLHTQVVDKVAAAQVVVYEVDQFTDPGYPNAIGLTYWPHVSGGVADGQCRIELLSWVPARSAVTAEHDALHEMGHCLGLSHNTVDKRAVMAPTIQLGDGYTKPTAADYRNLKTLYP